MTGYEGKNTCEVFCWVNIQYSIPMFERVNKRIHIQVYYANKDMEIIGQMNAMV